MRKNLTVGILKEAKENERRSPLVPSDVAWLTKRGIQVELESSDKRVFSDNQFKKAGARVLKNLKRADLLLGIKGPLVDSVQKKKIYMVFSHTAKGQLDNMKLLKRCLRDKVTLIDYEKIVDMQGRRLVYFGRFAGICGIVDSLHYLGKKLKWKGIKNPFSSIRPAYKYSSLNSLKSAMIKLGRKIKSEGLDRRITPFIIGITGHGNVSRGAQEIYGLLDPVEIHPQDIGDFLLKKRKSRNAHYKIVFLREEKLRSKSGKGFYFEEYIKHPKRFESNLDKYIPYLNMLIHTSYWDSRYPRLVTKDMVKGLIRKKNSRLEFIGDISCDVNGSIEFNYKTTTPPDSVFTYDFTSDTFKDGYKSKGITILSVDNLPAELPKDSSFEFGSLIRDYVYQIAVHGIKDVTNHMALPKEIRSGVITQNGRLMKSFNYLYKFL